MSAPDTNLDKQKERHAPSLIGMRGAMIFGALMLVLAFGTVLMRGTDSGDTDAAPTGTVGTEPTQVPQTGTLSVD